GVRSRHNILDVENRAELAAHPGAVVDTDALFRHRRRPGPIDQHAQHHPLSFASELHVEDFQPGAGRYAAGDRPDLSDEVFHACVGGPKRKKWAYAHFGPTPRLRIRNYSTPFDGLSGPSTSSGEKGRAMTSYSRAPTISTSAKSPGR